MGTARGAVERGSRTPVLHDSPPAKWSDHALHPLKIRASRMYQKIIGLITESVENLCESSRPKRAKNFSDGYFCGSLCPPIGLPLRCNAFRPTKEHSPMKSISTKICKVIFSTLVAATITSSAFATPIRQMRATPPTSTGAGSSMAVLDTPISPLPPIPPPCPGDCIVAALDTPISPLPPIPPPCPGDCIVAALDTPISPLPPIPPPCPGDCIVAALNTPISPLPPIPPPCPGDCIVAALDTPISPLPLIPPPCPGDCIVAALDTPISPLPLIPPPSTGSDSIA